MQCLGLQDSVMPILGVHFDEKKHSLNIFMPKHTSLYQFLHTLSNEKILTATFKKNLAKKLVHSIAQLH